MPDPTPEHIAADVAKVIPELPRTLQQMETGAKEDRRVGTNRTIVQGWIQTVVSVLTIGTMVASYLNKAEVRAELTSSDVRNLKDEMGQLRQAVKDIQTEQKDTFEKMWRNIRSARAGETAGPNLGG
jgi:hypothetical protein